MKKIFKNRYGEIRCAWAIIPAILLVMIGLLTSQGLLPEDYRPVDQLFITILYGLLTIGGGLLFKLFYKRGFNRMGLTKDKWLLQSLFGILIGLVATTLLFFIFILVGEAKVISYNFKLLFSLSMIVEIASLGVFVFAEEFLTRGYFMTALKTTRSKAVIFFTSAILFSLLHLLNSGVTLLSTLNTFLAGLLFAYMFVRTGKLWLSTGFHFAWNFMLGIFGLNVSGNEQAGVIVTEIGNRSLLVGGSYGPEGGLLVTLILLLCFVFVRFAIKKPDQKNIWTMESDLPLSREKH